MKSKDYSHFSVHSISSLAQGASRFTLTLLVVQTTALFSLINRQTYLIVFSAAQHEVTPGMAEVALSVLSAAQQNRVTNGHKTLPISSQEQVSRCDALGQKFYEGQLKVLGKKEVQGEHFPSLPLPEKRLKPGGSWPFLLRNKRQDKWKLPLNCTRRFRLDIGKTFPTEREVEH